MEEKYQTESAYFVHRKQGLFLSVYVDDITLAGKKQNLDPVWKKMDETRWSGRTYIFSWSCVLGVDSMRM